jgi:phytoene synthase
VEPLAETRFLVDAVRRCPPPLARATGAAGFEGRVVWVLELFERLDERDRVRRAQAMAGVGAGLRGLAAPSVPIAGVPID